MQPMRNIFDFLLLPLQENLPGDFFTHWVSTGCDGGFYVSNTNRNLVIKKWPKHLTFFVKLNQLVEIKPRPIHLPTT